VRHQNSISMDSTPEQIPASISRALSFLEREADTIGLERLAALIRLAAIEADDLSIKLIEDRMQ